MGGGTGERSHTNIIMNWQNFDFSDTSTQDALLLSLIKSQIINIVNTAFLAEVESINGNKVDLRMLFNNQHVPSVMVGFTGVNGWTVRLPIKKGDIGLCIVCKRDIQNYKETGKDAELTSSRLFAVGDSIFIPLSLYKQPDIADSVTIENENVKVTLTPDGAITIDAKKEVTVKTPKAIIDSDDISLGKGAKEPVPLGDSLKTFLDALVTVFNSHTHQTVVPPGPLPSAPFVSAPPASPAVPPTPAINSKYSKVR